MKLNLIIKEYLLLIIAVAALAGSCTKDPGNYNYNTVNEVSIAGVDSLYIVDYGHKLTVKPRLAFSEDAAGGDTSRYSYAWVADHLVGYTASPKILATTRDLDTAIKIPFGLYNCYLRVTDKQTGIFTDSYFKLSVGSPAYEGWMLLCDQGNDTSRLDMISRRGSIDTLYRNVLKQVNSTYVPLGKPLFVNTGLVYLGAPNNGTLAIFVATTKTATQLGLDSLEYRTSYNLGNYFNLTPPIAGFADAKFYFTFYAGIMHASQNLYVLGWGTSSGPINRQDGASETFKPSNMLGYSSTGQAIVFNEDNKSFLRYPGSGNTCLTLPSDALFDYKNTGMNLMHMEFVNYNGGEVFAVMKNPSSGKHYLARFTVAGAQRYYAEINAPDLDNATNWSVSPDLGYLFYNVGSKVYEYDFTLKRTILMKDYGSRNISVLKFQPFTFTYAGAANAAPYTELSKKLIVCTYSDQDIKTSGIVDFYTVPDINASLQLYKSFTGTGKVMSVAYRER